MEKEFVPYEQALALKELGFDEKCLAFKDFDYSLEIGDITKNSSWSSEIISIPLYQQAFRWFREKYELHGKVGIHHFTENTYGYSIVSKNSPHYIHDESRFISYEEAELECLKKLIEIVKRKVV